MKALLFYCVISAIFSLAMAIYDHVKYKGKDLVDAADPSFGKSI